MHQNTPKVQIVQRSINGMLDFLVSHLHCKPSHIALTPLTYEYGITSYSCTYVHTYLLSPLLSYITHVSHILVALSCSYWTHFYVCCDNNKVYKQTRGNYNCGGQYPVVKWSKVSWIQRVMGKIKGCMNIASKRPRIPSSVGKKCKDPLSRLTWYWCVKRW